jgi:hypothetical protein
MLQNHLRQGCRQVGRALREPEDFAWQWHQGQRQYAAAVWLALGLTAALGTTVYGMTMGLRAGLPAILQKGLLLTLAAGMAWAIPLPALYIFNSLGGSRLRASTTLLAALVTTSWGGLALIASVPINWLFAVAIDDAAGLLPAGLARQAPGLVVLAINLLVFAGVGFSMVDVFGRVVERLEPGRHQQPHWFLLLVGAIGAQLCYLLGLFA